jgi:hypothetical protein
MFTLPPEDNRMTIHTSPLVVLDNVRKVYKTKFGALEVLKNVNLTIDLRNLKKGVNYARWIEYAFSSSLMIVAIAMLFGLYDMAALLLIFALNAMMILFGWMMELHNQTTEKTDWTAFIFGSIAGIVPWIAIGIYLVGSVTSGEQVPTFVYAIYVSLFLFFNVFAVNMVLQYKKIGRWQDYVYGEKVYIVLSLVAKSLLAWQVFFGTLQPN